MQYRTLGAVDFAPSALGFGAMRLPTSPPATARRAGPHRRAGRDRHAARAVEAGVNYVDTA